jgi:GWxTD domain-containing protein
MKRSVILSPFFCCTALASAFAHTQSDSTVHFALDYARFRINATTAQVELYLAVPRAQLRFVSDAGELLAAFEAQVSIALGDSEVVRHNWGAHTVAKDTSEIKRSQLLYTQAAFQLPVNDYRVHVRVRDQNSGAAGLQTLEVPVEPFAEDKLALSDLEISSRTTRDTAWSPFYKNRYTVIPNPNATFGLALPMLYAYAEIYNLTYPSDSSYSVSYRIFDGQGNQVKALPVRKRPIMGKQLVEVGACNVVSLPAGSYYLEVRVMDHASKQETFRRRKFFVYREEEAQPSAPTAGEMGFELLMLAYRNRPPAELDFEFKTARYICTKEEQKIYAALDEPGKREFLAKFWQSRDRTPETPRNEYREEYLARVKFAQDNFSGLRAGYETDMGRVLLVYAQPSEIERFPSSSENRPYQIWKYFELEGGVEFIFVDVNNWGEYKLVHSTARGELADADWERWINPSR